MGAVLVSVLRTVVPYVWGIVIGWLITVLPVLQPLEEQLLGMAELALPVLIAVISAAWYAFWRWLEPRLPGWLTRAVLGSAKTPTYSATPTTVPSNTTADDAARIAAQTLDRVDGPDHRA
jgi:hypothetical protein